MILAPLVLFFTMYPTIGGGAQVKNSLEDIKVNVQQDDWDNAKELYFDLKNTWKQVTSHWVSLNFAEAEFSLFDQVLTEIETSIQFEDKSKVLEESNVLLDYLKNFLKVVPQP